MSRILITFVALLIFSSTTLAANPDSVITDGDLHITGGGSLVFSNGSVQSTAQVQGAKGDTGQPGLNGTNGLISLILLNNELPGTNCLYGGLKVLVGLDQNGNGILDASEVTQTKYVCNGSIITNPTGTYNGTAVVTVGGSGQIANLSYTVSTNGTLTGTVIDITDNNRVYAINGYVNMISGALSVVFQIIDGNIIFFSGTPTSGVWTKSANSTEPGGSGTYTAVKQ